jgi:hypothetical protein
MGQSTLLLESWQLHTRIIESKIAGGPYYNNAFIITRIKIKIKPSEKAFPFIMTRKRFPVHPCLAIKSNKSQGQTLQIVWLYLDRDFFSHDLYYAGQSRVRSDEHLRPRVLSKDSKTTQNVSTVCEQCEVLIFVVFINLGFSRIYNPISSVIQCNINLFIIKRRFRE